MSEEPREDVIFDALKSAGVQILAVGAIQAAAHWDLKRHMAVEQARLDAQDGKVSAERHIGVSPFTTGSSLDWDEWKAFAQRHRSALGAGLAVSLLWMLRPVGLAQGMLDYICVLAVYAILVCSVDVVSAVLAKDPIAVPSPSATHTAPLLVSTLDSLTIRRPLIAFLLPAVPLIIYYQENPAVKAPTAAAVSIATLVSISARWDLRIQHLWKALSTYMAICLIAPAVARIAPEDVWAYIPLPSRWIQDMLGIFPAALPAILPGLLIARALHHDYVAHDIEGFSDSRPGFKRNTTGEARSSVEDHETDRSTLIGPYSVTLPDFPEPTYRAALFTWIGSVTLLHALGMVIKPSIFTSSRVMQWPVVLLPVVYLAMILSARRHDTLQQLMQV